jgi:hypothetical protein
MPEEPAVTRGYARWRVSSQSIVARIKTSIHDPMLEPHVEQAPNAGSYRSPWAWRTWWKTIGPALTSKTSPLLNISRDSPSARPHEQPCARTSVVR